jgi:PKD repeat protein/photosystem II stability/assembly factor-like uncharacterized protein
MSGFAITLLLLTLVFNDLAVAQISTDLNCPPKSENMPEWAKLLYVKPVNIFRIDSALFAYRQQHPLDIARVASPGGAEQDGEESESQDQNSKYEQYYRRWRHTIAARIQPDGTLSTASPEVLEKAFRPMLSKTHETSSNAVWAPINMNTYFPGEDTTCPWQANVYALAVSKSNPNILVCGTEPGGIYRTTDKGAHWGEIGKEYLLQTEAIAIHPTDPSTIYLTTTGAIRKSTDAGVTWMSVYTEANFWGYRIEIFQNDPNTVLVAANNGFYRSTDAGATWTQVINSATCDIAVNPGNPLIVYAMVRDSEQLHYEFWKSYDGGASFIPRIGGWYADTSTGAGRLTVSAADPNRVYAVLLANKGPQILRSNDAGESWQITATGNPQDIIPTGNSGNLGMSNGQGYYDLEILASPQNADELIVGTTSTYRSTNGGYLFTAIGGYAGDFQIHPDLQDMKAVGGDAWIATDGGITLSTDFFSNTKNAIARVNGVNGSDFWGFDAGWNKDVMVGGRYHNGNTAISESFGGRFMRMGGGESSTGYVNPMHADDVYFSDIGAYVLPDSFSSQFSSIPIGRWPNESYWEMWYSRMTWDPRCYNTVWIGSLNKLYRSENGGASYDSVFAVSDTNAWIEHIEIARSNPNVMYITAHSNTTWDARIWKSTDGGSHWDTLPVFPGTVGNDRRVMTIAVSGSNENELWAALNSGSTANRVFHSTSGGMTWINLTTATISDVPPTDLMHQLGTDGGVYLATTGGEVFYRNHSMTDWKPYSTGLPVSEETRALKPLYRDGKLRVGSNLGIWETSLYEPSKPLAQPTCDKLSSACVRDTFYFDDYSALQYNNQTWKWTFPGASYVSSTTIRNPKVVYAVPGNYSVTLAIANTNGNDAKTITNMITVLQSECGIDSFAYSALDLTPANSSASIPPIPALASDTGFTITAWIKLAHVQASFSQIVSNWSSNVGFSLGFAFEGYARNTNLTFYWLNVPYQLTSPFDLDTNVWTHIAITVEPTKVTLYKDGIPWVYPGNFTNFDISKTPFTIGGGLPGQGGRLDGQIDELKFYDHTLTTQEIREKMHLIYPSGDTGLVAYYQFDESSPSLIYDRVGDMVAANAGGGRVISTAPIATGTSDLIHITKNLVYSFTQADIQLRYAANDTVPDDDVVAYRLFAQPDTLPKSTGIHKFTTNYWIIRNWGKNAKCEDSLIVGNIGQISTHDSANLSSNFRLFSRAPNEFLENWKMVQTLPVQQYSVNPRTLWFPLQDSGADYQQFIIGTLGDSPLDVGSKNDVAVDRSIESFPNPVEGNVMLRLRTFAGERELRVSISDMLGRELQTVVVTSVPNTISSVSLNLSGIPSGCYVVRVNDRSSLLIKK